MKTVEWMDALNKSIEFMENHLMEQITSEDVANNVNMSNFYYQKGFKILTGYTVCEYIRNRRLTLAGLELVNNSVRIIDLAYKYGYETPESFTKAFRRFHGILPSQVKGKSYKLQSFQPLIIKITVEGGSMMEYRIEKKEAFKVLGFAKNFSTDTSYKEIPKFWTAFNEKYCAQECQPVYGMYGVCIDNEDKCNNFKYLIADTYIGGDIPKGFEVIEIQAYTWAIFRCIGPMPEALQAVNTRIFSEWLPNNKDYEIATGINIEMYTEGDIKAADYMSEIWIPVKPKTMK